MECKLSSVLSVAVAAGMAVVASAQTPAQPSSTQSAGTQDQQVTVTGCVQREADYRRAKDAGKGGVAGTGAGVGNEFVLLNASMSGGTTGTSGATGTTGAAGTTGAPGTTANRGGANTGNTNAGGDREGGANQNRPGEPSRQAGTTAPSSATGSDTSGTAYELTGSSEGQAANFVGRRVEIVGRLKAADSTAGRTTGGVTANVPGSSDLRLRELDVTSVRAAQGGGTCPAN